MSLQARTTDGREIELKPEALDALKAKLLGPVLLPASELARRFGAESPEPTADPDVAYSDVPRRRAVEAPDWPPRG